jgi:serine protease Do
MKRNSGKILGLILGVSLMAAGSAVAERRPDTFADLVDRQKPTVVNIQVTTVQRPSRRSPFRGPFGREGDPFEDFFRRFFGDRPPRQFRGRAIGSGFIISKDGYIVTNNHVVEKASEIKVTLDDRTEHKAKLIGRDPETDLALLKIEPKKDLPFTRFGDSKALRVGDWVVAIGNPFGLSHTVTAGIVSAKGRVIGQGRFDNFIQTDASINQGNSGGPLFNTKGEVVGINTAIIAGGTGIGFAIPANMAKRLIDQLREKGTVIRGFLGVRIQNLSQDLAKRFGLEKTEGALVADVTENSPASRGGVQRGDVIVEFDGHRIKDVSGLVRRVSDTPVEKKVEMKVIREGDEKTLEIQVGRFADEKLASAPTAPKLLGLTVQPITPDIAKQMDLQAGQGILVQQVEQDSAAANAGIRRGDVILEINRTGVSGVGEMRAALAKTKKEDEDHLFLVQRNGSKIFMTVPKG